MPMPRITASLALVGLIFGLVVVPVAPVLAGSECGNHRLSSVPDFACAQPKYNLPFTRDFAAQIKRPRVTIYPRRVYPGPNATRQCRSWLTKEYRVSGPVIVPQMRCWWE
jgi:hypothetical protein